MRLATESRGKRVRDSSRSLGDAAPAAATKARPAGLRFSASPRLALAGRFRGARGLLNVRRTASDGGLAGRAKRISSSGESRGGGPPRAGARRPRGGSRRLLPADPRRRPPHRRWRCGLFAGAGWFRWAAFQGRRLLGGASSRSNFEIDQNYRRLRLGGLRGRRRRRCGGGRRNLGIEGPHPTAAQSPVMPASASSIPENRFVDVERRSARPATRPRDPAGGLHHRPGGGLRGS